MNNLIVVIITGPTGSGKTTISKSLAKRIPNSAHIEVDYLRHIIINGYQSPSEESDRFKKQKILAMDNAVSLTNNLLKNEFNVIIDDVVYTEEQVRYYIKNIRSTNIKVILLLPDIKKIIEVYESRKTGRKTKRYISEMYIAFKSLRKSREVIVYDNASDDKDTTLENILKITQQN